MCSWGERGQGEELTFIVVRAVIAGVEALTVHLSALSETVLKHHETHLCPAWGLWYQCAQFMSSCGYGWVECACFDFLL